MALPSCVCVLCLPHARLHKAREAVPTDSRSVSAACGGGSYSEGRPAHASRAHAPLPMTSAPPPCKSYSHSGGWPAEGSAKLERPTVALPRRSARTRATMLGLCARVAQSCTEKHARARAINTLARHVVCKASMCTHFLDTAERRPGLSPAGRMSEALPRLLPIVRGGGRGARGSCEKAPRVLTPPPPG